MDDTRRRILDTAEHLFASQGIAAVTLRSIAAAAQANVAAVNYHFGSKEKLFEEMFLRRVIPLNDHRLALLDECIAASAPKRPPLDGIVRAFVQPALDLMSDASPSARAIIVQFLLGRILAMPEVNRRLTHYYDELRIRFVAALRQALPRISERDAAWRYYWMGGCVMCSLAIDPAVAAELGGTEPATPDPESLIGFVVKGCLAGQARTG
jgi:AcrR family transcriptional regulator